jgi:thiamine pyrophosphate-dependent acetolactate synthase large subunit-like protein
VHEEKYMKIYEAFAAALLDHGVDPLFGLMGDANMVYVGNYRERGGRFVPTAHECSSVGMANAWSRATGRVGVATVTCGPGMANTFTTLVEAVRGRSEVLLLTGDAPLEPTHFQQLDLSMVAAAAGAGYEEVLEPGSVIRDLNRAMQRVVADRKPVVLNLPQSMLLLDAGSQAQVKAPVRRARLLPDPEQLDNALGLVASSKRPVILAGRGAIASDARETLVALADRLAAPLATTVLAKDLFRGHPSNLGICGSLASSVASAAISESDCVIAFGASLNAYTTFNGELTSGKKIIQVDDDARSFGSYVPVDEAVHGDVRAVAQAMADSLDEVGHTAGRAWLEGLQDDLARYDPAGEFTDRSTADTVDVRTASIRLDQVLPAERSMVSDIGRFVHAAWPHIATSTPIGFTTMGAFGSVGLGLAGAIGMSVARPDEPTVCVIGDGGFMMNPAELATAVREKLPLIVVVYDDGAYGFEYHKMIGFGADPEHSLLSWPEISGVAEAMGAHSITVRKVEEFDEARSLAENLRQPLVIVVKLDPTVDIVP